MIDFKWKSSLIHKAELITFLRSLFRLSLGVIALSGMTLLLIFQSPLNGSSQCECIFTPQFGLGSNLSLESHSGAGSSLSNTSFIQREIPKLLKSLDCEVLIDAPCGDFYWMQNIDLPVQSYIGVDCIRELIDFNQQNYGNESRYFLHLDLTEEVLPKGDIVLTRDLLVHFSFEKIFKYISLLKKSGIKYLLTTNFSAHECNYDIETGGWRPLNLTKPPFNFPDPILTINEHYLGDHGYFPDKSLSLWKIEDLALGGLYETDY